MEKDTENSEAVGGRLHPLVRLARHSARRFAGHNAHHLTTDEARIVSVLVEMGFLGQIREGFVGLECPEPDIPLGKCTCGGTTGTTGIECCNQCGFPIREESWQPQFLHPRPFVA